MPAVILLFFIYSVGCYCDTSMYGIYTGCPPFNFITYSFVHLHFFHLVLNSVFLIIYWNKIRVIGLWKVIPILVAVPIIAGTLAVYDTPTVGCSSVIMSLIGILGAYIQRQQLLRLVMILGLTFLITWLFAPHINTLIHLLSFALAYVVSITLRYARQ